jgi:hypothetical protein
MTLLRKIRIELVIFCFGLILGWGVYLYGEHKLSSAQYDLSDLITLHWMSDWSGRAGRALKEHNPAIAQWAMENFIDVSEKRLSQIDDHHPQYSIYQKDLVWAYARLAIVAKAQANGSLYKKSIDNALKYASSVKGAHVPKSESDIIELAKKISTFSDDIMEGAFPMASLDPTVAKISRDGFHPESPPVALKPEPTAYSGPARNILRITWEFTGDRREGRYVRLDDEIIHSNGIVAVEFKNNTNQVHEYMYPEICGYYATMLVGMDEQRFNAFGPSARPPSYFKLNPGHVIRWNIDFRKNVYYKNAMGGSDLWPLQNGCHKVRFSFGGGFMKDTATVCYAGREDVLAADDMERKHSCSYLNPPLKVMERQIPRKETLVSATETCDFFDLKHLLDQQKNISKEEYDSAIRAAKYPCPMLADFIIEYVTLKNIDLVSK